MIYIAWNPIKSSLLMNSREGERTRKFQNFLFQKVHRGTNAYAASTCPEGIEREGAQRSHSSKQRVVESRILTAHLGWWLETSAARKPPLYLHAPSTSAEPCSSQKVIKITPAHISSKNCALSSTPTATSR